MTSDDPVAAETAAASTRAAGGSPGRGLVLFPPGTTPGHRRRRLVFLAVYAAVAAAIVWPVYPLFSKIRPLVLGLPFSLTWVVLALGVIFVALLWLYRSEPSDEEEA